MNEHLQVIVEKQMERTVQALRKNQFDAHALYSREALFGKLRELMPPGSSCSVGGSVTLFETGVVDFLREGDYTFFDRYAENAVPKEIYRQAFGCDAYLMSSNAITEEGELYNIDGNGNRVAALVYGPEKVIVIAGYNKIVKDLDAARERKAKVAAPANAVRLNKDSLACYKTGACVNCKNPARFCAHEVVSHFQMIPGRITVLILNEQLGF